MILKKGFSLIELLVVIAIIAILSGFGIYWFINYKFAREVEDRTYKVYALIKKYQLWAKTKKETYCFKPESDNLKLVVEKECSSEVEKLTTAPFKVHVNSGQIKVNEFGIFTLKGSIYFKSTSGEIIDCKNQNPNIAYCCVAVSAVRVCLGKYDKTKTKKPCECSY